MRIKCEYCDNFMDDSETKCPSCGAPNKNAKRTGVGVPTTIEELKQWYEEHHLPPYETTRFFIGINYEKPKAFGIYKDDKTGNFVVYKNKDTGDRAIRYEGTDEKYAVNELYLKLKEEIAKRKGGTTSTYYPKRRPRVSASGIITILSFIFIAWIVISAAMAPDRGYYRINDNEYYYVSGDWYKYDKDDWVKTTKPDYSGDLDDYYDGSSFSSGSDYSDITDSDVYDPSWDYSSDTDSDDWDSSSDWDSGSSWDSGSTDWGSDW